MTGLPEMILARVAGARPSLPRVGVVVSAVAGPPMVITVRTLDGGDTITPMLVESVALPTPGDKCLLTPTEGDGWVYSGRAFPKSRTVYQTLTVPPVANWRKARDVQDGTWWMQYLVTDPTEYGGSSIGTVWQGRHPKQEGGVDYIQTKMDDYATVLWHDLPGVLADLATRGATIYNVTFSITRVTFGDGPEFVTPVMYGHGYTPSSPPNAATAPTFTPGYGPVRLAPIGKGQTSSWVLPSGWVTAAASGVIKGFGFWSDSVGDRLVSWTQGATVDRLGLNASLVITYTLP